MRLILLLLALVAASLSQAPAPTPTTYMTFDDFISKFNKPYQPNSEEYNQKKQIYDFNVQALAAKNCSVCGVTKFFDIAPADFEAKVLNLEQKDQPVSAKVSAFGPMKLSAPRSLDWRTTGCITSIKDQGECGCCWSFATMAMSESSLILKGEASKSIDLSEQYLLRCTPDSDCGGGYIENAVDVVLQNGAPLEEKYPYEPYQSSSSRICLPHLTSKKISDKPRMSFYGITDNEIKNILSRGPVAIAISATNWQYYTGGVWRCQPTDKVNHAVLLVGWTDDGSWIIKNQWGADWGENGYIRVSSNSYSNCKIGTAVHSLSEPVSRLAVVLLLAVVSLLMM